VHAGHVVGRDGRKRVEGEWQRGSVRERVQLGHDGVQLRGRGRGVVMQVGGGDRYAPARIVVVVVVVVVVFFVVVRPAVSEGGERGGRGECSG
jgi:hypothetical protein